MYKELFKLEGLKKENQYLKKLLSYIMQHGNHHAFAVPPDKILTRRSSPEEKIALFKLLFKGRSDTYAVRWETKNGKSGYAPACQLEWQRPICRKPDILCSDCANRQLLPLTNQVLYDHLSGKKTIGLYPLQKDDTCSLLVLDFDKKDWREDVAAFVQVCSNFQVPVNIERSRSGNGAHVWIFFTENIPAALARKFGHALLETARKMHPDLAFDSFDRMLPNQDTLSKGGFGNLIALPLQLHSKKAGNSVFVDQTWTPFPDQWLYLSTIMRLSKSDILKALNILGFEKENEILPEKITIRLKNGMHIKKNELSDTLLLELKNISSFHNPAYYKAQAQRKSTYHIQKVIQCYDENEETFILPRGCRGKLKQLLEEHTIKAEWVDETYKGEPIDIKFHGSLTPLQEEALQQFTVFHNGVLSAPTGFGKTVLAAALIAKNKTNTLIVVDRTQLQRQWREKLAAFLNIPLEEIGQIGGGKKQAIGRIDVATIQSLHHNGQTRSVITQYGQVIVDECHHISAFTFEKVLKNIRAKYVYGLSATPIRKDGLHPIIFMQCGSIRFKVDAKTQAKIRPFIQKLIAKKTNFTSPHSDIQTLYKELAENNERNQQIFNDVLLELEAGRSPMILTERVEHVKILENKFKGFVKNLIVLSGNLSKKERELTFERLENIPDDSERLIIATGKFIGEGFDDSRLDTLFLAMPFSWKGTLQQYTGRLHRNHANKEEVKVYDYVDIKVPVFKRMYAKRLKGYRAMGYALTRKESGKPEQMQLF